MKVKDLQKELAELLIHIAENYPDMEQEVDPELTSKICDIEYKTY